MVEMEHIHCRIPAPPGLSSYMLSFAVDHTCTDFRGDRMLIDMHHSCLSYATLLRATDGLSEANLIGAGSFGVVCKGLLYVDDRAQFVAAVKVFSLLRHGAAKCFISGCEALRNIKHRNLIKIITACSSVDSLGNDFMALVYGYMEQGSLEKWLLPPTDIEEAREAPKSLNLMQRLNISIDVACALD